MDEISVLPEIFVLTKNEYNAPGVIVYVRWNFLFAKFFNVLITIKNFAVSDEASAYI